LFRIDPSTGEAREISLGGESVPNGDGILLTGKTPYAVQNQNNRVPCWLCHPSSRQGASSRGCRIRTSLPTTIDDHGSRLYAVNARFGVANPGTAEYQIVQLAKPRGR
jgi:hypothetical protein